MLIKILVLLLLTAQAYAIDITGDLSWECPTTRVDGTPYDCTTELKIYTVYDNGVVIWTGLEESMTVTTLDGTTGNYTVTATDHVGLTSDHSPAVMISTSPPMAPIVIYNYGTVNFN